MKFNLLKAIQVLEKKEQIMGPGAGLEPARPQRSGDFEFFPTTTYLSVTPDNSGTKPFVLELR